MAATPKPIRKVSKEIRAKLREKNSEKHPGLKKAEMESRTKHLKKAHHKPATSRTAASKRKLKDIRESY